MAAQEAGLIGKFAIKKLCPPYRFYKGTGRVKAGRASIEFGQRLPFFLQKNVIGADMNVKVKGEKRPVKLPEFSPIRACSIPVRQNWYAFKNPDHKLRKFG